MSDEQQPKKERRRHLGPKRNLVTVCVQFEREDMDEIIAICKKQHRNVSNFVRYAVVMWKEAIKGNVLGGDDKCPPQ